METIKEIVVVEGKNDSARLKSIFDVETIETQGLGLSLLTLDLLSELKKKRGLIIFTDPDIPGEKIRAWINAKIPECKNAFLNKKEATNGKKVGVEHASSQSLKQALDNLITYQAETNKLSLQDLYTLGLNNNKIQRLKICFKYHLGECNQKTFLKRLNMLGVTYMQLQKDLNSND